METVHKIIAIIKSYIMDSNHAFEFYGFALLGFVCHLVVKMDKKSGSTSEIAIIEDKVVSELTQGFSNAKKSEFIQYGIDVSHYQGRFLGKVTKLPNIDFVISKATEGISYIDNDFHYNWESIQKLGLIRGAYHFYISSDNPIKQAEHYASVVGQLGENDLPPIIDVEELSIYGSIDVPALQKDLLTF